MGGFGGKGDVRMRVLASVALWLMTTLPAVAWATVQTSVACSPAAGGGGETGITQCSAAVEFDNQRVQTQASVKAGYASAAGFARISALWGTAAAGSASFLAMISDRVRVEVRSDDPVYAVFSAPQVTGRGAVAFDMLDPFDLGFKQAQVSTVASMSVSTAFSSYATFGSITETTQEGPAGYTRDVVSQGAPEGRIELFTGQDLTISWLFGGSVAVTGSASASVGVGGSFAGIAPLGAVVGSGFAQDAEPVAGLFWQGIRFETADGSPLSTGSVLLQSDSGTDWTQAAQPIPEPATWALWALGLTGMLTQARRIRRT